MVSCHTGNDPSHNPHIHVVWATQNTVLRHKEKGDCTRQMVTLESLLEDYNQTQCCGQG